MKRSKENNDRSATERNRRYGFGIRSTNQRRGAWAETEKEGESGDGRSSSQRDIATVARLREAVNRSTPGSKWADIATIFGAVLMASSVLLTLTAVLGISARANRLIENDAIRARAGGVVVERLEGKLDQHISETEENGRKLDTLLAPTSTTTTTVARRTPVGSPRTTVTTRRPTPTTPTTPTTIRPTPPTTQFVAPATTLPPCRFGLLNICLSR